MDEMISRRAVLKLLSAMPPEEAITKAMLIQSVQQMDAAQPKSYREGYQAGFKDAQPERKTGKWTKISPASIYECSVCGQNIMTQDIDVYSYCHGCGAKMEVNDGSD